MISYKNFELVLAEIYRPSGYELPAIRGRFQNLRRLGFPDEINKGTGNRFAYRAPDVMGVVFCYELMRAFVQPWAAVETVREGWPELVRAWIAAAVEGNVISSPIGMPMTAGTLAIAVPNSYDRSLAQVEGIEPGSRHLEVVERNLTVGAMITPRLTPTILFDVSGVLQRLLGALGEISTASAMAFGDEMGGMVERFGWADIYSGTADIQGGYLVRPRFWQRALQLLHFFTGLSASGRTADDPTVDQVNSRRMAQYLAYVIEPPPIDRAESRRVVPNTNGTLVREAFAYLGVELRLRPLNLMPWPNHTIGSISAALRDNKAGVLGVVDKISKLSR